MDSNNDNNNNNNNDNDPTTQNPPTSFSLFDMMSNNLEDEYIMPSSVLASIESSANAPANEELYLSALSMISKVDAIDFVGQISQDDFSSKVVLFFSSQLQISKRWGNAIYKLFHDTLTEGGGNIGLSHALALLILVLDSFLQRDDDDNNNILSQLVIAFLSPNALTSVLYRANTLDKDGIILRVLYEGERAVPIPAGAPVDLRTPRRGHHIL